MLTGYSFYENRFWINVCNECPSKHSNVSRQNFKNHFWLKRFLLTQFLHRTPHILLDYSSFWCEDWISTQKEDKNVFAQITLIGNCKLLLNLEQWFTCSICIYFEIHTQLPWLITVDTMMMEKYETQFLF